MAVEIFMEINISENKSGGVRKVERQTMRWPGIIENDKREETMM
jgi:hypothetical protein